MDFAEKWALPMVLAIGYSLVHLAFLAAAKRPPEGRGRLMAVDLALGLAFAGSLAWGTDAHGWGGPRNPFLRLWAPIAFFWWAYAWTGRVLHVFHPPGHSLDDALIRLEGRWLGQPSLWMAMRGGRALNELMHAFYASYYLYTPVLGAFLHINGRWREFEAMSFAVLFGYLTSYACFPLVPVWGPRWGLLEAGLLEPSRQILKGYRVTDFMNRIMYSGPALKGGAMPSAHASTAWVFLVWCGRLWGWEGAVAGSAIAAGMAVSSVYGRYHYVADVAAGVALGIFAVGAADWLYGTG